MDADAQKTAPIPAARRLGTPFLDWRQFALSLTRNDADAEDLVDDAVLRTLRAEPRLKGESEVHAYLLTAIRDTSGRLPPEPLRGRSLARPAWPSLRPPNPMREVTLAAHRAFARRAT